MFEKMVVCYTPPLPPPFFNKSKCFMEKCECTRTANILILKQYMDASGELEIKTVPCRLGSVDAFLSPIRHLAPLMLSLTMTHSAQLKT